MTTASQAAAKLVDHLQQHPDAGYALALFLTARLLTRGVLSANDLMLLSATFDRPDHVATARAELAKAIASQS